jgi:hypothetical protein
MKIDDERIRRLLLDGKRLAKMDSPPPAGHVWACLKQRLCYRERRYVPVVDSTLLPATVFFLSIATFAIGEVPSSAFALVALLVPASLVAWLIGSVRFS